MSNFNKNSTRSVTPSNINKGGASREFLNRSNLNMKNPVASNASFSSGFGVMKKTSISKSPSNFNSKKISISKADNNKSFDINVNKSFDKSREFNPKSTFKINSSKSPVSASRTSVKKPNYGNISISTNASPIYRNNKISLTPNKTPDNHMIKQYNDNKNKNASPSVYSNFIKKKPANLVSNVKKIPAQTSNNNNNFSNSNINNTNQNNKSSQNIEKKTINSNMNSIDVSTNNTNGLNSNNARNNGNNENDCFQQIQPKYEEENRLKQNNNLKNNNMNNNNNNQAKSRDNKFANNNSQDFRQMNTSPLLRVIFIKKINLFY